MTTTPQHVIFGTGAIGLATLDALLRRGETVRMVNRSGVARVPDDVEVVAGDAADPQFTIDATRGARVVYQTLNPPYADWAAQFPGLQAGVLAAAEAHGARLVSMENVYMYGRPAGRASRYHCIRFFIYGRSAIGRCVVSFALAVLPAHQNGTHPRRDGEGNHHRHEHRDWHAQGHGPHVRTAHARDKEHGQE